ncbi:MAG: SEC-C metal-binding domain-containing protein [bacterium]
MDNIKGIKEFLEEDDKTRRSYKIGRNEPCPCGSGKKYKKCCATITPEKSKEYYKEKIKKEDEPKKVYELLKEADKDYPLDPTFILPIIVYSLHNQDRETAGYYLRKAWRVMKADLDDVFIMPLVNLMLSDGEIKEAEEVVEKARQKKGDSPHLLISHGEVMKAKGDFDKAFADIEKGLEIEADNTELIVFKLETLLDLNELLAALEVWYNRYDLLKELKGIQVLDFLKNLLRENFALARDAGIEETKAVLEQAIKANRLWQDIYDHLAKQEEEQVEEKLKELEGLLPHNSPLVSNVMDNYNDIEDYERTIEYGERVKNYHQENHYFQLALGRAFLEKDELVEAGKHLRKSFDIARSKSEKNNDNFNDWDLVGEYLRYLLEREADKKLLSFIEELKELVPEGESLISVMQLSLDKYDLDSYPTKLLLRLNKLKDKSSLIDGRELFITYLYTLLLMMEKAQKQDSKELPFMREQLKNEVQRALDNNVNSPLVEYAELKIREEDLSDADIKNKLERIKKLNAEHPHESIAQYEALLNYGKEGEILTQYPSEVELAPEYVEFYELVAAIKDGNEEKAGELFPVVSYRETKRGETAQFLMRLLQYMDGDKLENMLKKINVNENYINILQQIRKYLNR